MSKSRSRPSAPQHVNGAPAVPTRVGPVRSICVYCGSGPGENPAYVAAARTLGRSLGENGIRLVYGGGGLGLMGEVARSTLEAGGQVTGIIPEFLVEREHMLREVTDLLVTADMHQRKKMMFERSDAFVALPGGIGTLEELVEQLTWAQLGQHNKPIIVANVAEFWTPFLGLLEHMRKEAFIRRGLEVRLNVVSDAREIVPQVLSLYRERDVAVAPGALSKF
ncbi:TIGR00730 family Rossman fold protein [uncultured Hyphomicrobium sp.]|uniref:LOG family protein n=1 Tax=uncultured Hyphomicrobium sp. TaxID=194373 RepID=UPI0025ED69FD|nr:TIGR00730 family Rossman fold protein [uncultured Hyphomicrobium sp.]